MPRPLRSASNLCARLMREVTKTKGSSAFICPRCASCRSVARSMKSSVRTVFIPPVPATSTTTPPIIGSKRTCCPSTVVSSWPSRSGS
eukprot:4968949-Prymnesium_polylepis.1